MWKTYREQLGEIVERLAPPPDFGYGKGDRPDLPESYDEIPSSERAATDIVDAWGVTWHNAQEGIAGIPKVYPLANWKALDTLKVPGVDVDEWGSPVDWRAIERGIAESGHQGYVKAGGIRLWERMWFLRGMESLMMDVATGRPEVQELLDVVVEHNMTVVDKWLSLDVDGIGFGDDWGTQERLLINPRHWRRYFKPAYAKLFERVKRAGKHTWLHSDGYILPIIPDLIEIGLDVINPQLNCNGADNVGRLCRAQICVDADLDRQYVIPFGTPAEVREHVRQSIKTIASDDGGMLIIAHAYPLAPLENVAALYEAFNEYCPYPSRV